MARLKDKVTVVTGAGRNIGEAAAHLFAKEGAKVAVVDLNAEAGAKVAADIRKEGGIAESFSADVSDEAQVDKLFNDIVAKFGRVDGLVNNVAISDNKHMLDITVDEWNRTLKVTLTAPLLMTRAFARKVIALKTGGGKVINVGSTSGFFGRDRAVAYTAAKGGLVNLTKSMAIQLAPHNIRVVLLVPNKIGSPVGKDTFDPSRPVKNLVNNRPGVPADVAGPMLFLLSEESDFITGTSLFVDAGCSVLMPGNE